MATIEGKLGDLLDLIGSDETLTPPIIEHLRAMAERDLAELAGLSGLKLAGEIRTATKGAVEQPLVVANRLRQLIAETFDSDQPTAGTQGPIQVEVRQEKTLAQLRLGELLAAAATDPSSYAEILPYLEANPQYAAALAKTENLGVPNADGRLDAEGTTTYITTLARPSAKAQRVLAGGRRPKPIEKLLGLEVRDLIHPFTLGPIQGPDENGFDWGALSDELHKAVLWAHVTRHPAWPTTIDAFQHGSELFADPLPARWQRILEDYRAACEDDESNIVTSRYHTAESKAVYAAAMGGNAGASGGRRRGSFSEPPAFPGQSAPAQPDYRTQLEELGDRAGRLNGSGHMTNFQGGVYAMVDISGHMCNVAPGTVVMRGGRIAGSMNTGVIYAPLGVMIDVSGHMNDIRVVHKDYDELARIAGLTHR